MSELDGLDSPPGSSTDGLTAGLIVNAWHALNDAITSYVAATDIVQKHRLLLQVNEVFRRACEDGMASALAISKHGRYSWWIICGASHRKTKDDPWSVEAGGVKLLKDGLTRGSATATWSFGPPGGQKQTREYQLVRLVTGEAKNKINLYILNEPGDIPPPPCPEDAEQLPFAEEPLFLEINQPSPVTDQLASLDLDSTFEILADSGDNLSSSLNSPLSDSQCMSIDDDSRSVGDLFTPIRSNKCPKRSADSEPYNLDDQVDHLAKQMVTLRVEVDEVKGQVKEHQDALHALTDKPALRDMILGFLRRHTRPIMTKEMVKILDPSGCITKSDVNKILYKMKNERPPKPFSGPFFRANFRGDEE
ncbi:hypothetical protein PROFUN_02899 [Planoprotostelium fungivorum]|uniref:Uncharacterized protein n=1 Tax=Planoprotostelium fungivorum TaxID=1890364 RepID=A0A2P6NS49_9EUKA|nr:hypothetical protein PROFUN_02899 [Planoprotostelium fungivorum]